MERYRRCVHASAGRYSAMHKGSGARRLAEGRRLHSVIYPVRMKCTNEIGPSPWPAWLCGHLAFEFSQTHAVHDWTPLQRCATCSSPTMMPAKKRNVAAATPFLGALRSERLLDPAERFSFEVDCGKHRAEPTALSPWRAWVRGLLHVRFGLPHSSALPSVPPHTVSACQRVERRDFPRLPGAT